MPEESNISGEDNILGKNAESAIPTNTADSEGIKSPSFKDRQPALVSSYTAIKYVGKLSRNKTRKSDRLTDIVVFSCLILATVYLFAPTYMLKPPLLLAIDISLLVTTSFFIIKRLGILITLSDRQAVLVWDMVTATLLLGFLLGLNALVSINYLTHLR